MIGLFTFAVVIATVPPALQGTDQPPSPAVVAAVPTGVLVDVVADAGQRPLHRARAARLLGARSIDDDVVDDALRQALVGARGPLAAQLTLALADRARGRGDRALLLALANVALASVDVDVARAGVHLYWQIGGDAGRARLEQLSMTHADERVRGACRGRLRRWAASGGDDGPAVVLDPPHGGPSPAR